MAKNTEVQEQAVQEPVYDPMKDMVRVILPRTGGGDDYMSVGLNGKLYRIRRGVAVMVPRPVSDIIDESMRQQERQDRYVDELETRFRSAVQRGLI